METVKQTALQGGQFLTFKISTEVFAIGILHIKEIIEYGQITRVPLMSDAILGVINLRGAVVPVIDLSYHFWRQHSEQHARSCIVILELQHEDSTQVLGIMVDAVNEVIDIAAEHIKAAPAFGGGIQSECIAAMGRLNDSFVIMLDIDKVFSVDEVAQLQKDVVGAAEMVNDDVAAPATDAEPAVAELSN
jgi:purine-binding chemotaxis protein CheW